MGIQPFYVKRPHPLLLDVSRAALGRITVSGIRNSPNYCVIFIIYRVIQEESAMLWEMIVCVILSKKVHMNMGPIFNGYRDMVKRRYGPSCEHEQQLRNK